MKKVLYVATVLSHICQFHLSYLKIFQEKGYEVHVAARDNLAEKNGLQLKYTDKQFNIPFRRSPFSLKNIAAYRQLKKIINDGQYELIVCNTPVGGILTRKAAQKARKKGTKVVYIAHGFHFYKGAPKKNWLIYYPIEKHYAKKCDIVVTITNEDYVLATKKFKTKVVRMHGVGVSEEKYHVADINTCKVLREKENLKQEDFVVLCTGELNKNKNQSILINAVATIKDKIPNLKVLLAGNGPMREKLLCRVKEQGLEGIIRFLGYRTDLEKVVPATDLIVSCSFREGLPLNILEAMLCKKPIVASINRGHKELITDGVNGYLFNPTDCKGLAEKILAVFEGKDKNDMGENSYIKAKEYTIEAVKKEIERIYEI